jgi:hypothetical protein
MDNYALIINKTNKKQQICKRSFKRVESYSMDSKRKPKQVWEMRYQGMQGRGRPPTEWAEHKQKVRRKKREELAGGD